MNQSQERKRKPEDDQRKIEEAIKKWHPQKPTISPDDSIERVMQLMAETFTELENLVRRYRTRD